MDGFSNTARKDGHVLDDPTISVVVGGRHYLQEVRVLAALTCGKAKGKKKRWSGPVLLYPSQADVPSCMVCSIPSSGPTSESTLGPKDNSRMRWVTLNGRVSSG